MTKINKGFKISHLPEQQRLGHKRQSILCSLKFSTVGTKPGRQTNVYKIKIIINTLTTLVSVQKSVIYVTFIKNCVSLSFLC